VQQLQAQVEALQRERDQLQHGKACAAFDIGCYLEPWCMSRPDQGQLCAVMRCRQTSKRRKMQLQRQIAPAVGTLTDTGAKYAPAPASGEGATAAFTHLSSPAVRSSMVRADAGVR
jgi:hypothetical protein